MTYNPNDSAFPGILGAYGYGNSVPQQTPNGDYVSVEYNQGITLRALLAGMAMQGILVRAGAMYAPGVLERESVERADQLIKALNCTPYPI